MQGTEKHHVDTFQTYRFGDARHTLIWKQEQIILECSIGNDPFVIHTDVAFCRCTDRRFLWESNIAKYRQFSHQTGFSHRFSHNQLQNVGKTIYIGKSDDSD